MKHTITSDINNHLYLKQSRSNVEVAPAGDGRVTSTAANYRDSADRLSVHKQGNSVCALFGSPFVRSNNLFNTFTIIRYADRGYQQELPATRLEALS